MKALLIVFGLLYCAFAQQPIIDATKHKPLPPQLPEMFSSSGNFWTFDEDYDLLDYGRYVQKYDWTNQVERIDIFIAPEGMANTSYLSMFKNKHGGVIAMLLDETGEIECHKLDETHGKVSPPDILAKSCKFQRVDVANGLALLWKCKVDGVKAMIWTNMHTGKPIKEIVNIKDKDKIMVIEIDQFDKVESFDSKLFQPPESFECPRV